MRRLPGMCATLFGVAVLSITPISVKWSAERTPPVVVSVDKAHAVVGRPATPASVAGAHRRHGRRAVRRCAAGVTC
jgi:hypothetical protein